MKGSNHRFSWAAGCLGALAALLLVVDPGQAQIVTLSSGGSTASIDTGSQAGMFNWVVDGQDQLAQQAFWYRLGGSGLASPISTISAPAILNPDSSHLTTTYTAPSFSIRLDYVLSGGVGTAGLHESITINNTTANALDFHFFQYSDFDLGGTPGGDTVQLGTDLHGQYNYVLQQKSGGFQVQEADVVPSSTHAEAGFFPQTLNELNGVSGLQLNDNAGPLTGDVTWAFEWDYSAGSPVGLIPGGGSVSISKVLTLTVPEPSSAAFIGLGMLALALRLRRSRNRI
jgi:PEP-CTERM motif